MNRTGGRGIPPWHLHSRKVCLGHPAPLSPLHVVGETAVHFIQHYMDQARVTDG